VGWGWWAKPAGGQGHGQGSSSDDDGSPSHGVHVPVREALNRGVALHRAGDLDAAEEW